MEKSWQLLFYSESIFAKYLKINMIKKLNKLYK